MYLSNYGRLPSHLIQQMNFKKVLAVYFYFTSQALANTIQILKFSAAKCQRSVKCTQ